MQHDWATPTPLQYFAVLVQSDDDLPLLEAAASLAQDDWPELDVQQVLADVDQLAARLQRRVDRQAPVLDRLGALGQFFSASWVSRATPTTTTRSRTATCTGCCTPAAASRSRWPCCGWSWRAASI
jgi:hypothetical protein